MNKSSAIVHVALVFCALVFVACGGGAEIAEISSVSSGDESKNQEDQDKQINYLEFPATDVEKTKQFYSDVFGWEFTDYGPGYTSFREGQLAGGFTVDREVSAGGLLFVLYSADLEEVETRVREAGGQIAREVFEFPGGRRFHFTDPSGNELAVWSDQ